MPGPEGVESTTFPVRAREEVLRFAAFVRGDIGRFFAK